MWAMSIVYSRGVAGCDSSGIAGHVMIVPILDKANHHPAANMKGGGAGLNGDAELEPEAEPELRPEPELEPEPASVLEGLETFVLDPDRGEWQFVTRVDIAVR